MKIYQATIKDVHNIAHLFNLYRVFYGQPSNVEDALTFIAERLEKKDSVIFIVKDENEKAVAFAQLYPTFSSISMKNAWILNDLYVDIQSRKLGIGQKLLDKAKEYAIETGAIGLNLSTAVTNTVAQGLYEKNHYVRDTQFYHYQLKLS